MWRQGDLLFIKVNKIYGKKQKDKVIALGELTGHSHELTYGDVYQVGGKKKYLSLGKDDVVKHQEHNPIELPAGNYEVIRQREYKPVNRKRATTRTVVD